MFKLTSTELEKMGAEITTREIKQQPELWQSVKATYQAKKAEIDAYLLKVKTETNKRVRVIFTGAGSSQFVGDTVVPYLNQHGNKQDFIFQSVGTTDIVSAPEEHLFKEEPTLLVSFARSGNSPESVASVEIANQYIDQVFHLTITCAADGKLAEAAAEDDHNLLLLMPKAANDAGFAMTGSFSCMTLTALLVFDQTAGTEKLAYVDTLVKLGKEVLLREDEIQQLVVKDYKRIVYVGSGSLAGLTREAQLKVLELTAGKIATVFDSSLGFRHGPKSFIDEETLVFVFVNNWPYTRQYDLDLLNEIYQDDIAMNVTAITQTGETNFEGSAFVYNEKTLLPDGYLALADIVFAQTIALLASIKIGNTPDTPSPSGTVNRVVKGVTIHPFIEA